jgi:LytS/YehU family sensor histidine kinase
MDFLNEGYFVDLLNNALELLERVCVVLMVAFVSMRVTFLRRALSNVNACWQYQLCTAVFFGVLAVIGTHSGLIVDINQGGKIIEWVSGFKAIEDSYAIFGFRDLLIQAAGLFGGPWVGLGAGLLAGWERYDVGGFAGIGGGAATVLQGLSAGLARRFWPEWTVTIKGVLIVSILSTCLQQLVLLCLIESHANAVALVKNLFPLILPVNSLGCLLFFMVIKDLDSDRLKLQAQQSELRALHAQIEPHFLNNTLNAIQTLIRKDPNTAAEYVAKLARFMDSTRQTACANAIPLAEEVAQLKYYLDFQSLRFPGKLRLMVEIPDNLMGCYILPRSLQTLAENTLLHGRRGKEGLLEITLKAADHGDSLQLSVQDNGCGISPERLEQLGKQIVQSDRGGGSALYQMCESLNLAFDGRAALEIRSQLGINTVVLLTLPKRSKAW